MAVQFAGNQDYRGYLNYLATQGDQNAMAALQITGNDAGINDAALREVRQGATTTTEQENARDAELRQYVADRYAEYQGAINPQYKAGGGSAGTARDQADEAAYWQDQMSNADRQLARLPGQLDTGNRNVDSSYQTAYDRLVGDKATTNRDYTTKRGQTVEDNITAKSNIDTSVRNTNTGLQRLLGSKGAGNSSAAQVLAPYAAAKQGNSQRGQVQTAFGRNLQGLDTAWGDYEQDWNESAQDLQVQRENQKKALASQFSQTEAGLQEQKANAAVQQGQARGQSYATARNARAPYLQRIQELVSQIDSLGTNVNLTPKTAAYKAPELQSYTYDRYAAPTAGSGVDPNMAQGAGAYWTLLNGAQDEKKRQLV